MPSPGQLIAGLFFLVVITHRIYRIVYLLFFSPLHSIPGPKLWACSRIPYQSSLLRGHPHLDVLKLHLKYGPAVRIGPNTVAFFTAQSFKDIYTRTGSKSFKKDRFFYEPPINGINNVVCAIDDVEHNRHRRLLAPGFSGEALKAQEPLVTRYVDALIHRLTTESKNGPVNIAGWFNSATFDITADLMFGESFGCLANNKLDPWIQLIFKAIKAILFSVIIGQFPVLKWLVMKMMPKSVLQQGRDHFNLSAAKSDRRIAMGTERQDLMSGILKNGLGEEQGPHLQEEKIMSRLEVHSNAYILIIAGSETSATLLSGVIYYLCKYPAIMQRLASEIRTTFESESGINFHTTSELKYLNAVIEEGLRVYPPFLTGLSRIAPPGGEMVDGYFMPENCAVATHFYATFHSPHNFHLPDEFIPERWLGTDSRFSNDKLEAVQAFSLGTRGCLGKPLAYAEIRLILTKLLFHFDISLDPASDDWVAKQEVYFIWDKGPLMVNLKRRNVVV